MITAIAAVPMMIVVPQVGLEDDEATKHSDREDHRDEEVAKSCQEPMLLLEEMRQHQHDAILATSDG